MALSLQSRRTKNRPAGGSVAVAERGSRDGDLEQITFGDVVITARRPSEAEIQRNAALSSAALARALPKLLRPGVRIYPKKGVPLYSADPEHPSVIIRKLNGKVQRGIVENGQFKATD
jgi:hypothetical protein